jgi:hypothetical protein
VPSIVKVRGIGSYSTWLYPEATDISKYCSLRSGWKVKELGVIVILVIDSGKVMLICTSV